MMYMLDNFRYMMILGTVYKLKTTTDRIYTLTTSVSYSRESIDTHIITHIIVRLTTTLSTFGKSPP